MPSVAHVPGQPARVDRQYWFMGSGSRAGSDRCRSIVDRLAAVALKSCKWCVRELCQPAPHVVWPQQTLVFPYEHTGAATTTSTGDTTFPAWPLPGFGTFQDTTCLRQTAQRAETDVWQSQQQGPLLASAVVGACNSRLDASLAAAEMSQDHLLSLRRAEGATRAGGVGSDAPTEPFYPSVQQLARCLQNLSWTLARRST
ncbi:uncharacterized protein B0I36DRAFT_350124 [Microdochium trichocladiopsis]|uniref:Uncharacterized protein n=1 Tax=Microdochium trichocladiopsis TaxID=1682393 RepID=A0A9P8Y2F1_9PEZI|nr:uncharacterized protein B0I36DRAFT_350124 [Microdochium trichocladiopsis]KAH7029204.1 hypothetical protein B0I36DRAFT_350124 [Microdochium trichocladiopsis]